MAVLWLIIDKKCVGKLKFFYVIFYDLCIGSKIAFVIVIAFLSFYADMQNRLPNQLSGGQQQRAAIARALATKPAIILADEPTGNLDRKTSQDVLSLLKVTGQKFRQTIVMITHLTRSL